MPHNALRATRSHDKGAAATMPFIRRSAQFVGHGVDTTLLGLI